MVKVFAIGGSIVRENLERMEEMKEALEFDEQIVVVTGAGDLSKHQKAVQEFTNNGEKDLVGVQATRLNARTMVPVLEAYPSVPETPEQLLEAVESGKNVVMGGLTPGHSTDAVGAIAAELLDAELYIPTTVDAVYNPHPDDPEPEKLEEVTPEKLMEIVGDDYKPGSYELVDETAVKIIQRSDIRTKIFEGSLENLSEPEKAEGTEIVSG